MAEKLYLDLIAARDILDAKSLGLELSLHARSRCGSVTREMMGIELPHNPINVVYNPAFSHYLHHDIHEQRCIIG